MLVSALAGTVAVGVGICWTDEVIHDCAEAIEKNVAAARADACRIRTMMVELCRRNWNVKADAECPVA